MGNWSELPLEIIHMISVRIDNPFDLIHYRSVCSSWRSSSLLTFRPVPSLRCPVPPDAGGDDCYISRSRVYLIKSLSSVPFQFWLFKLLEEENGLALHILFSRRTFSVWGCSYPSLSLDLLNSQVIELAQEHVACYTSWCDLFDDDFANKEGKSIGFMQLDAENKEFIILRRLSIQGLGMYRSFDKCWTEIEIEPDRFLEAVASYNGLFYAIDSTGVMIVVKPSLEVNSFHRSRPCDKTRKRWLAKLEEKLLLVEICTESQKEYLTPKLLAEKGWFEISELDEKRNDWIQVEDVGGHVLFLDCHCSFSCLPTQIPGFRPNSIIFECLYGSYRHKDFQVFEFGEQGIRSFEDISEYAQL
ncbi:hypothetical protein ARALYDRAFT_910422 [Arabidopsis lyrata subsp. lyrata]|uniref:KIB1-4 beta-propeller domain-containing protein n=1 Tax=Arabidopsis lyrata subsp. lyrata TaxID=81972 RepID=D7M2G0_ARALL|nr:putative F-box/kelch-repeat protein At5g24040 [Arabidopsis lyrata subsp. lyrata]EFH50421.1 hypothetical protein ARALYDRAFT_910422 [Arabidopsis lyrata subsp. lyrata]|eukprot:XP_002874162.1 putative F-box/kelch-repeat protein At5g24040 [Arabidopsis lyrata subsp. lyrata]